MWINFCIRKGIYLYGKFFLHVNGTDIQVRNNWKKKKSELKTIGSNLKSCHTFLQTYVWGHTSVQQTPPHVYYIHDPCTMFCTFVWIVSLPLKHFFRHIYQPSSIVRTMVIGGMFFACLMLDHISVFHTPTPFIQFILYTKINNLQSQCISSWEKGKK